MAFGSIGLARPERVLQCRQSHRVAVRSQAPFRGCFFVRASSSASSDRQGPKISSKSGLMRQRRAWLVAECQARGLESSGAKEELADRLMPALLEAEPSYAAELPANTRISSLKKMKKVELMAQLSKRNLSTHGNKSELVTRLMAALQTPAEVEVEEDLAAAALQLGRKLDSLDRSVFELSTRVEQRESSRAGIRQAAMAMLSELTEMQVAWDTDQAELAELEDSVAVAQDEKSLLPALAARKEAVLARLQKLKVGIKGKEVLAVELREKLQLVQRAKEVGVGELLLEEEEVEEVMAVMAGLSAAAAAGDDSGSSNSRTGARSASVLAAKPVRRSASRTSAAAANGAIYGPYSGPGRVQEVSAKTPVNVPQGSGTPPPSPPSSSPATTSSAPTSGSSDPPAAASPTTSRRWAKLRRPEAVGIAFSAVIMTVFSGIRSVLK